MNSHEAAFNWFEVESLRGSTGWKFVWLKLIKRFVA